MAGTVQGTSDDDVIDAGYVGDAQGDRIDNGDNILAGRGPEDDLVEAFEGNDTVMAGAGDDEVYGGADDDRLFGEDGDDSLFGGQGNDIAFGGAGADVLDGGEGEDTLKGGDGADTITGGAGNDWLGGQGDRDTLIAGAGDFADGGDTGDDFDTLDLRGIGPYRIEDMVADSNGNGFNGTVVFLGANGDPTGETIRFVEIENFLTDDPANQDPVAGNDTAETDEDESVTINVLDNDTDPDGDPLTVTSATSTNGTVTINPDGTLTFTPAPDYNGPATITYTVEDGNGGSSTATVDVTVNPVNDAPVAEDDTAATDPSTPVDIPVLDNDSDVDNDPLTVTSATATNGTVRINPDGTLTYTPNDGFEGEDTITYTIDDGNGGTDTGIVTVSVGDGNLPPDAVNDTASTTPATAVVIPVLANDIDPEDDPLTVTAATAANGTVTINADGTITYTPNAGFTGQDTITYTITDGISGTDTATVLVTVSPVLPGPDGTVEGTAGNDLIDTSYTGDPEGDFVDNNDAILPGDTGNDDLIFGYGGDDVIMAGDGDDVAFGNQGDDTIYGGDGNDSLYGNIGNDSLSGGAGDDLVRDGAGDNIVNGGSGDDRLYTGGGNDSITGGTGNDLISGGNGDDVIDSSFDGIGDFDNPYPPLPADAFPFDDRDTVYGGAGNDTIRTGDDRDTIFGGSGDDRIDAGIDDDLVEAGSGNDRVVAGEGNDTVFGRFGDDTIFGGLSPEFPDSLNIRDDQGDLVPDNGRDVLFGGWGNDTIYGLDDDDTLFGGMGNDFLDAGIDDDTVFGGFGNDTIINGQGNDLIYGGGDRDVIIGGNGGDVVFGGSQGDDFDTLDLTGTPVDFITYTSDDREDGFVTFRDGSILTFTEIENVIPCFTPGTAIATPRGERLVEELREGDRIITRDNGIQEIRWIGRKEITGKALMAAPHLRPVLIKAGALGNGLPERDIVVSPNHRMLVSNDRTQLYFEESEVLAAAKHLVGAPGINVIDVIQTTYIHFMFDRHEVVLSNGAWTESFQPGDYSLKGIGNAQRTEIFELFPELKTREGIEDYQSARKALKRHEAQLLVK